MNRIVHTRGTIYDTFGGPYCTVHTCKGPISYNLNLDLLPAGQSKVESWITNTVLIFLITLNQNNQQHT